MPDCELGLPIRRRTDLLCLSRGALQYQAHPVSQVGLELMRRMGVCGLYRKPETGRKHAAHTVFP